MLKDDNASIRTTTSTFSRLSRGGRWPRPFASASTTTLPPSYDDVQTQRETQRMQQRDEKRRPSDEATLVDGDDDVPSKVTIDSRGLEPFVAIDNIEAHLTLLTAFRDVRQRCYAQANKEQDEASLWTTYLRRASYRLALYMDVVLPSAVRVEAEHAATLNNPRALLRLTRGPTASKQSARTLIALPDDALPPLDVAMAWHAYLLNPGRYAEDVARVKSRRLLHLIEFPLQRLAAISTATPDAGPVLDVGEACMQRWQSMTSTSFALSYVAPPLSHPSTYNEAGMPSVEEGLRIACPMCARSRSQVDDAPQLAGCTLSWRALSNADWQSKCDTCGTTLTANVLRGSTFTEDVETWLKSSAFSMRGGLLSARNGQPFPCDPHATVLCRLYPFHRRVTAQDDGMAALMAFLDPRHPSCNPDLQRHIDSAVPRNDCEPAVHFLEARGDIERMSKLIDDACQQRLVMRHESRAVDLKRRVALLMRFYMEGDALVRNVSLDVASAVQRQFTFVEEMDRMGWLDTATFGEGQEAKPALLPDQRRPLLARCIVRYHRWLNVLAVHNQLLCPTLDIDLAWHTHQLQPGYYADCFTATDLFIDHDDKIDTPKLGRAFDKTATLWFDMYKQPYSVCGCPVHNKGGFMKKLKMALPGKGKQSDEAPLTPEQEQRKQYAATASHPSAHNGVTAEGCSHFAMSQSARAATEQRHIRTGERPNGHADVFVRGFGRTPLQPFEHIPAATCDIPGKCMTGPLEAMLYEVGPSRCVGVMDAFTPEQDGTWHSRPLDIRHENESYSYTYHYDPMGAGSETIKYGGARGPSTTLGSYVGMGMGGGMMMVAGVGGCGGGGGGGCGGGGC